MSTLLEAMDKASAIRQLTGCYGGRGIGIGNHYVEDANGLFGMTVSLLHAAYTGNILVFSTLLGSMRDTLRDQKVMLR